MELLGSNLESLLKANSNKIAQGKVISKRGAILYARLPTIQCGEVVTLACKNGNVPAIAMGFENDLVSLLPLASDFQISPGTAVIAKGTVAHFSIPPDPRGLVLDALGNVLDPHGSDERSCSNRSKPQTLGLHLELDASPPKPLERASIKEDFPTGIRCIDALLPLALGQRVGLFAPAGVGKSTLLGSIARNANCDCVVVALVGERGREVTEFIDDCLGEQGKRRSVVVCATSDEPPARRMMAVQTATSIAEYYRDSGLNVLLLVDSLTRVARALREVYLCLGELPVRQGYPPSVYTELPRLVERAGMGQRGSITAIYTVLTNSEDDTDPLAEELTGLLDGHLVMSQRVALRGIRPAIDPTKSISRLAAKIRSEADQNSIRTLVSGIARLWREKDLLMLGGQPDPELSNLINLESEIIRFLNQHPKEQCPSQKSRQLLFEISQKLRLN